MQQEAAGGEAPADSPKTASTSVDISYLQAQEPLSDRCSPGRTLHHREIEPADEDEKAEADVEERVAKSQEDGPRRLAGSKVEEGAGNSHGDRKKRDEDG
jgi:hypothetical protein